MQTADYQLLKPKMRAEREGFEPPEPLRARLISSLTESPLNKGFWLYGTV
jgi:hypothetical protein